MTAKEKLAEIFKNRTSGWCEKNCMPNEILFNSFDIPGAEPNIVNINNETKEIKVLYEGGQIIDKTTLVAEFTVDNNITVFVNEQIQQSGITKNNFTNPVVYNLTDGTNNTQWTVTYQ